MLIYKNLLYSIELKIIAPTLFLFKHFLETINSIDIYLKL